ncbi:hypothetical protein [Maridesulfovibrio hydrothermalis]|uniref:Uncharacterized protein n=2 Tax=Maridesulfovibrio TaxID=2794998 RepID=L0RCT2_9BACT|nr:hypothetical protein [Maridesulfovibrio hydrothermalis]CCO24593.1 protein of unknown function [Maridesulfovibrio hydrothermalis AM13 = DSM 14728]
MKSSKKSGEDALFQLPFNGLGFSLETCADEAGELHIRYFTYPVQLAPVEELFAGTTFTGFSGYELLVTLGREIRGR